MDPSTLGINRDWTLFLDRDGVINRKLENAYVRNWDEYEFLPGAKDAIRKLAGIFGTVIVVTNQQGIGKGLMTTAHLANIHERMVAAITESGGRIDGIYYCPHLASDNCDCRKPRTGMAKAAAADHPGIELARSIMVGDSAHDMAFGKEAGMRTVGVGPKLKRGTPQMDFIVPDLATLASLLAGAEK